MAGFSVGGGFAAGAGADALEQLLARKFAEGLRMKQLAQEQQRINLEAERNQIAAADRQAAMQDLANTREQNAIKGILTMTPAGTTLDPATAARGRAAGFGSSIPHEAADLPSRAISGIAQTGANAPIVGALRMVQAGRPERDTFTGTADQLAAEQARTDTLASRAQAREDRAAALKQAEDFKREMATQAQQGRVDLAHIAASGRNANADLQRELLQTKVDAAKDKETEKKQAADTAKNAAVASIDDTASALDELIDEKGQLKPGVGGAVGWDALMGRIPGTSAADAKARIDRLQSRLTVDLLGEMKRQSRTGASGFGALSEKELMVLQNAAARLGTSQSDESFRQALVDIRKQLAGMRQRAAGAAPVATGGGGTAKETPEQRIKRLLGGG